MNKLARSLIILKKKGISGLILYIYKYIFHPKINKLGWKQYELNFSPLKLSNIEHFIKVQNILENDLVIVPEVYKNSLKKKFKAKIISTYDSINEEELSKFNRLIYASDRVDRKAAVARFFYSQKKKIIVMRNIGPARVWGHDELKEKVLISEFEKQSKEGIAKFSHGMGFDFGNLLQIVDNAKNVEGDFVEIGCFKGSSTCVIAEYLKRENIQKRFIAYDYFDGFTYEQVKNSIDNNWENTHLTDGKKAVEERVKLRLNELSNNFEIYKKNIIENDALKEVEKIAFANIDVDMYEAVLAALFHVHAKLSVNGMVVVEDAGHTPFLLGAKVALEEFLDKIGIDTYHKLQLESGQYLLIKKLTSN